MQETGRRRVQQVLGWLLSGATVLFAVLLIVQCIRIYQAGIAPENIGENGLRIHDIYSREIVAAHFAQIAWSFYLWLGLLLACLVVGRPQKKETLRAPLQNQLALMRRRTEMPDSLRQIRQKRIVLWSAVGCVCLLCAGMAGRFLLDWRNFASRDLEPVIKQLAISVFPWIGLAFAGLMVGEEGERRLQQEELVLRREAPKKKPEPKNEKSQNTANVARLLLLGVAVALIVLGIRNGGMFDVLVKAINICTECIGLG